MNPTPSSLSALINEHETKLRDNPWPIEDEKMTYILPLKEFQTLLALSRWALTARESLEVVKMSDIAELSRSEAADALARFPLPHAQ
jgi:hypothetical protein